MAAIETKPDWVNVVTDDVCTTCNSVLQGGIDRGRYDMGAQEFVACNHCEPCEQSQAAQPFITITATPELNILGNLVSAIELFARANGCADKVDLMLAAMIRAAK